MCEQRERCVAARRLRGEQGAQRAARGLTQPKGGGWSASRREGTHWRARRQEARTEERVLLCVESGICRQRTAQQTLADPPPRCPRRRRAPARGAAGRVGAPGLTRSSRRAWPSTMAGALAGLQRGGGRGGSRGGAARTKERTAAPRRILTRRSSNCCRTSFQSGVPSSLSSSLVPNSARFSSTSASARPCPWSTPWLASTCGRRGSVRVGRCSGGAQQRDESLLGGVGPRPLRSHDDVSTWWQR